MSLGNAIGYLTAARIPARRQVQLGYSLHYFPWVGAAIGSLSILLFLLTNRFLPNFVCCVIAVVFPQFLSGWDGWRGILERLRGEHTHPGHGYRTSWRFDPRAFGIMACIFFIKFVALASMPLEWQTRAVFIFPILGTCARTAVFLMEPAKGRDRTHLLARSRVRAGFLSAVLVFLVFLFPVRAALPFVAVACGACWYWVRRENRRTHGLTLQTASTVTEVTEGLLLVTLAIAAPFLAG